MPVKPFGIIKVFYKDKAGNKIIQDMDGKLAVVNRHNNIVRHSDAVKLLRRAGFKVNDKGSRKKLLVHPPRSLNIFDL